MNSVVNQGQDSTLPSIGSTTDQAAFDSAARTPEITLAKAETIRNFLEKVIQGPPVLDVPGISSILIEHGLVSRRGALPPSSAFGQLEITDAGRRVLQELHADAKQLTALWNEAGKVQQHLAITRGGTANEASEQHTAKRGELMSRIADLHFFRPERHGLVTAKTVTPAAAENAAPDLLTAEEIVQPADAPLLHTNVDISPSQHEPETSAVVEEIPAPDVKEAAHAADEVGKREIKVITIADDDECRQYSEQLQSSVADMPRATVDNWLTGIVSYHLTNSDPSAAKSIFEEVQHYLSEPVRIAQFLEIAKEHGRQDVDEAISFVNDNAHTLDVRSETISANIARPLIEFIHNENPHTGGEAAAKVCTELADLIKDDDIEVLAPLVSQQRVDGGEPESAKDLLLKFQDKLSAKSLAAALAGAVIGQLAQDTDIAIEWCEELVDSLGDSFGIFITPVAEYAKDQGWNGDVEKIIRKYPEQIPGDRLKDLAKYAFDESEDFDEAEALLGDVAKYLPEQSVAELYQELVTQQYSQSDMDDALNRLDNVEGDEVKASIAKALLTSALKNDSPGDADEVLKKFGGTDTLSKDEYGSFALQTVVAYIAEGSTDEAETVIDDLASHMDSKSYAEAAANLLVEKIGNDTEEGLSLAGELKEQATEEEFTDLLTRSIEKLHEKKYDGDARELLSQYADSLDAKERKRLAALLY